MKNLEGKVISKKMAKTAVVLVVRPQTHPLYQKIYRKVKKYHVQDEIGTKVGERVRIQECRPLSKTKKWRIVKK